MTPKIRRKSIQKIYCINNISIFSSDCPNAILVFLFNFKDCDWTSWLEIEIQHYDAKIKKEQKNYNPLFYIEIL